MCDAMCLTRCLVPPTAQEPVCAAGHGPTRRRAVPRT